MGTQKRTKKTPEKSKKSAPKKRRTRAPRKSKKAAAAPDTEPITPPVPVSLRLPGVLLAQLRSVATERRNRAAPPYTQGAIIEAALREWLEHNKE